MATNYNGAGLPGMSAGAFQDALQGTGGITNLGMGLLNSNIDPSALQQYMNPFTDSVINSTMSDIDRQKQLDMIGISDAAINSGSFGGSRHGVRESMLDRQYAGAIAPIIAGLRSSSFDNAQNMMFNMAGLGGNLASSGLGNLGNLSNLGFGMARQINSDQMNAGSQQQSLMQAIINSAKGQFAGYTGYPMERFGIASSLPGIGGAGTTTAEESTPYNPMGDIISLIGILAGKPT